MNEAVAGPERVRIDGVEGGCLDPADRGLQYGDGLFETIAIVDGSARRWPAHVARLQAGCARLGIPAPSRARLEAELAALAPARGRAVLKLLLTRGGGGRGYRPPARPRPTLVASLHQWPAWPAGLHQAGARVRWCRTPLPLDPATAGIKHLNRLPQVLARAEWEDPAIFEGLMLDPRGRVVCGTMSNLFCRIGDTLLTPPLKEAGVAGILRQEVLERAAGLGMVVREGTLRPRDVEEAREVFLTNSLIEILPVTALAGATRPVGEWTRALAIALGGERGGAAPGA